MKRFLMWFRNLSKDDPVKHCQYHRDMGCAHVDGIACDMKTCKELKEYREFLG